MSKQTVLQPNPANPFIGRAAASDRAHEGTAGSVKSRHYFANPMTISFIRGRLQMSVHVVASKLHFGLTNYRHPIRAAQLSSITRARSIAYTATTPLECIEIQNAVQATQKVPGEMAEVGVFRGGSAAVILNASHGRHLHLFDTFAGLPTAGDYLKKGEYAGSREDVARNLAAYTDRISLHPGLFPEDTAHVVEGLRFSFVHLDMDLYGGTLGALRFFWPRMNPGGILVSHDYPLLSGVVRAFQEFFSDQPACFMPLSGQQCMAVKIT
jgi:O-methyltransferase